MGILCAPEHGAPIKGGPGAWADTYSDTPATSPRAGKLAADNSTKMAVGGFDSFFWGGPPDCKRGLTATCRKSRTLYSKTRPLKKTCGVFRWVFGKSPPDLARSRPPLIKVISATIART